MGTEALQVLIGDYLAHCRARGLSYKTVKDNYGYALNHVFLPWCQSRGIEAADQITSRHLDHFSSELQETGGKRGQLSPATVKTYVESVNWFLAWAHGEGEIASLKAQTPKQPRRVLDVLSRQEIQAMEDAARTERDKLIVRVLADTGMRLGELLGLKDEDMMQRGSERYLRLHGKGALDRLVGLPPPLYRRLERLKRSRPAGAPDRLIYPLRRRPGGGYVPLTKSGAEQVIRGVAAAAGIDKRVYPHLLRHSYATFMLNKGANPITLARQLGHSSLAMMQRVYVHQSATDVHDMMLRLLAVGD